MSGPWPYPDDHRTQRPLGGRPTRDEVVAQLVVRALLEDPDVRAGRLDVLVQNGVAILDGIVPSEDVRSAMLHRVRVTPGVRDVVNLLNVDRPEAGPT
ncbi:MAG TPA: BON domain-containing protein [Actinoplanes sp.]|nr:BON domain-containing protein [Actinoplanes sp.]